MNGVIGFESDDSEFVEVDPSGRYGRYNAILGKGASKIVYRAFDEYEGIEVAWNQVKVHDFLQNPDDLQRLYCEIHLLKTLKHDNIMKFYTSWVDIANMNINFVTEMFTSGTLKQYRLKHRRVNIKAVKHWCRQILKGLLFLHTREPPIIHRDLKCDNIFINGNQGEVKIGDLGLAAILRKSHAARCVGTPEFMAPEVYAEEYNELVDIYSFGMCILEMVTFEYPYSECTHPAQIYKKVVSGKRPDSLYKVEDPEVRRFVEKCLASVSNRLSALELLNDPFLQVDDYASDFRPLTNCRNLDDMGQVTCSVNGCQNYLGYGAENHLNCNVVEYEANELDMFSSQDDDPLENVDITIKGRRRDDDGIFLRLRVADKEGRVRNIYFPFDIQNDTALTVATEMIAELDIIDQDVTKIAEMIDGEIASLLPEWKRGFGLEENIDDPNNDFYNNCASNCSLVDYLPSDSHDLKNLQILQCSRHGCGDVHGRFEEITYQLDGSEQCVTDGTPVDSSQSGSMNYTDIWAQRDGPELSSQHSGEDHSGDENEASAKSMSVNNEKVERIDKDKKYPRKPPLRSTSASQTFADDYENEIRRELRWLKAKYQIQLRVLRDQQLGVVSKSPPGLEDDKGDKPESASLSPEEIDKLLLQSFVSGKHFTTYFRGDAEKKLSNLKIRNCEATYSACSPEHMATAKNFYTGTLLPQSLHRATSLPVDATDF